MAAVTVNNRSTNVNGAFKERYFNISGADTNTLDVGAYSVRLVTFEPGPITGYTITANTPTSGNCRITFSASGPFTGIDIAVTMY